MYRVKIWIQISLKMLPFSDPYKLDTVIFLDLAFAVPALIYIKVTQKVNGDFLSPNPWIKRFVPSPPTQGGQEVGGDVQHSLLIRQVLPVTKLGVATLTQERRNPMLTVHFI